MTREEAEREIGTVARAILDGALSAPKTSMSRTNTEAPKGSPMVDCVWDAEISGPRRENRKHVTPCLIWSR
jgi:hypothetical protein